MNKIKQWFLKRELRHGFVILGYKDGMIRIIGKRFLDEAEVKLVHKWRDEGKIIQSGIHTIKSPHGFTDTNWIYKLNF